MFAPLFDVLTADKLRSEIGNLPAGRENIERIIEDFYQFDDAEKEEIRTYKKRLLSNRIV